MYCWSCIRSPPLPKTLLGRGWEGGAQGPEPGPGPPGGPGPIGGPGGPPGPPCA